MNACVSCVSTPAISQYLKFITAAVITEKGLQLTITLHLAQDFKAYTPKFSLINSGDLWGCVQVVLTAFLSSTVGAVHEPRYSSDHFSLTSHEISHASSNVLPNTIADLRAKTVPSSVTCRLLSSSCVSSTKKKKVGGNHPVHL